MFQRGRLTHIIAECEAGQTREYNTSRIISNKPGKMQPAGAKLRRTLHDREEYIGR